MGFGKYSCDRYLEIYLSDKNYVNFALNTMAQSSDEKGLIRFAKYCLEKNAGISHSINDYSLISAPASVPRPTAAENFTTENANAHPQIGPRVQIRSVQRVNLTPVRQVPTQHSMASEDDPMEDQSEREWTLAQVQPVLSVEEMHRQAMEEALRSASVNALLVQQDLPPLPRALEDGDSEL